MLWLKHWQFKVANVHARKYELSEEQLLLMQGLWECTPLSAASIADELGVTKGTVIGYADRRSWVSFRPGTIKGPKTTFSQRIDQLNTQMDMLLGI